MPRWRTSRRAAKRMESEHVKKSQKSRGRVAISFGIAFRGRAYNRGAWRPIQIQIGASKMSSRLKTESSMSGAQCDSERAA
jgi:hypothetical protein